MAQVRLVGGAAPVEATRAASNAVGDQKEALPCAWRKGKHVAEVEVFTEKQRAVGDVLIAFAEACQVDLSYRRALREHWWQD